MSSSGGYATTKPHTRSSWTCTYKAGRQHQAETHIWETPLPEPSTDEYTLPTNMRQTQGNTQTPAAMLDSMEYTVPISTPNAHDSNSPKAEYTKPVKGSGQRDSENEKPLQEVHIGNNPPTGNRMSQANYYYYDPLSGEQTEYLAPTNFKDKSSLNRLPVQQVLPDTYNDSPRDNVPVSVPNQENRECDYRTLIRLDDPSN